jgi:hypothetical protein
VAKSRLPELALLLLLPGVPAHAQAPIPLTPAEAAALDGAMRRKPSLDHACTGGADEIVVCGRRSREPMEFPREPGEIVRHINEPGLGVDALAADRCTRLCNVGVSVNLLAAARAVPKIFRHILGKD